MATVGDRTMVAVTMSRAERATLDALLEAVNAERKAIGEEPHCLSSLVRRLFMDAARARKII